MTDKQRELFERVVDVTRKDLEITGGADAICVLANSGTGHSALIRLDMSSEAAKEASSAAIRLYAQEMSADLSIFVSEGWATNKPIGYFKQPEWVRPSQDPERQEIVIFAVETLEGSSMARVPIIRDGDSATFGEVKLSKDLVAPTGRFVGIIPSKK